MQQDWISAESVQYVIDQGITCRKMAVGRDARHPGKLCQITF